MSQKQEENIRLRRAGAKIIEAFDKGFFVRDVSKDHETGRMIEFLPYLQALAQFKEEDNPKTSQKGD